MLFPLQDVILGCRLSAIGSRIIPLVNTKMYVLPLNYLIW